jgi:hypothetical protein
MILKYIKREVLNYYIYPIIIPIINKYIIPNINKIILPFIKNIELYSLIIENLSKINFSNITIIITFIIFINIELVVHHKILFRHDIPGTFKFIKDVKKSVMHLPQLSVLAG